MSGHSRDQSDGLNGLPERELDVPLVLSEQLADIKRRVTHLETLEGGAGGDLVALDKAELTVDTALVTFASISGDFASLKIIAYARTDRASTNDSVIINFNNDVAANYYRVTSKIRHSNSLVTTQGIADTKINMGEITGDTAPANAFSALEVLIPSYANADNHKVLTAISSTRRANTSTNFLSAFTSGHWANVAAITEIDLAPGVGPNFLAGSQFYLYGMRASA